MQTEQGGRPSVVHGDEIEGAPWTSGAEEARGRVGGHELPRKPRDQLVGRKGPLAPQIPVSPRRGTVVLPGSGLGEAVRVSVRVSVREGAPSLCA